MFSSDLIRFVCASIYHVFQIMCTNQDIFQLTSTTPQKFSAHLIFHIPNAMFQNNLQAGLFVRNVLDNIKTNNCNLTDEVLEQFGIKKKELRCLFVKNKHENDVIFCDHTVYTRNRHFRSNEIKQIG